MKNQYVIFFVFCLFSTSAFSTPVQRVSKKFEFAMKGQVFTSGESIDLMEKLSGRFKRKEIEKVRVLAKSETGLGSLYIVHNDIEGELYPVNGNVDDFKKPGNYDDILISPLTSKPNGSLLLNITEDNIKFNLISITIKENRGGHNLIKESCTSRLKSFFAAAITISKVTGYRSENAYQEEQEAVSKRLKKAACLESYDSCLKKASGKFGLYCEAPLWLIGK